MLTRRATTTTPIMPLPLLDLLLRGALRPRAEREALIAAGEPYNALLKFTTSREAFEQLWHVHRSVLLAQWIHDHPGSRPDAWWRFESPEPRRRTGGIGEASGALLERGVPRYWVTQADARAHPGLTPIDTADPPRFESEATYLDRLKLMVPAERRRVPARAFLDVQIGIEKE